MVIMATTPWTGRAAMTEDDTIHGGNGDDILNGGPGKDIFLR